MQLYFFGFGMLPASKLFYCCHEQIKTWRDYNIFRQAFHLTVARRKKEYICKSPFQCGSVERSLSCTWKASWWAQLYIIRYGHDHKAINNFVEEIGAFH